MKRYDVRLVKEELYLVEAENAEEALLLVKTEAAFRPSAGIIIDEEVVEWEGDVDAE